MSEVEITDEDRQSFLARLQAGVRATKTNVHTSHCCAAHGCKYGDMNCPVERKELAQQNLCERCEDAIVEYKMNEGPAETYARSVVKRDLEEGNYILVDGKKLRLGKLRTATATKAQYADLIWAVKTAYLAGVSRT